MSAAVTLNIHFVVLALLFVNTRLKCKFLKSSFDSICFTEPSHTFISYVHRFPVSEEYFYLKKMQNKQPQKYMEALTYADEVYS